MIYCKLVCWLVSQQLEKPLDLEETQFLINQICLLLLPQDYNFCQSKVFSWHISVTLGYLALSFSPYIPTLESLSASLCSGQITGIALGVPAGLIFCLVLFFLGVLYHRGLAIRRKRAMRRYLESGEVRLQGLSTSWAALAATCTCFHLGIILGVFFWQSFEPLGPGEKGTKVHARILRPSELKKFKPLGSGVFGAVNKVFINLSVSVDIHWLSTDLCTI